MTTDRLVIPYASPANVLGVVHRYRDRNLPEEFNVALLSDIGIPKANIHRILAALRFLSLIGEGGEPTATFQSLQTAPEAEYQAIFGGVVRNAYQEPLKTVDPSRDSQLMIDNHFRRYTPQSQRHRMVTLFLALCREAGIATLDTPRQRGMKRPIAGAPGKAVTAAVHLGMRMEPTPKVASHEVPSFPRDVSGLRQSYIAALIEKVKQQDSIDEALLDRIERLLKEGKQITNAERPNNHQP